MSWKFYIIAACVSLVFPACGSSSSSSDEPVEEQGAVNLGGPAPAGGSATLNAGAGGAAASNANDAAETSSRAPRQYLSFVRRRTLPDNAERPVIADIIVYDFKDDAEINLTNGSDEVDCISRLCSVNPELTWVAWLDPDRNKLKVAPIDFDNDVIKSDEENVRVVSEDVDRVQFMTFKPDGASEGTELLVYTKASPTSRQVIVEPAAGPGSAGCAQFGEGCKTIVGTVNQAGAFRVTQNGQRIVLIDIDLGTMTIKLYELATGLEQTIYQFGQQNTAGSQWSGRLPVALSPDATFLIVGTNDEKLWKINRVPVGDNVQLTTQELFEVRNEKDADGKSVACGRDDNKAYWEIMLNPLFTADSKSVYLLVHGDCTGGSRQDYDIMKLDAELTNGDWTNITNNKPESVFAHHEINYFDLSADGTKLAFVSEKPNKSNMDSIWLIDANTGEYDCSRVGMPAGQRTDGKALCEFITYDPEKGTVNHQHVRFHYR